MTTIILTTLSWKSFEDDVVMMIENIKLRLMKNDFIQTLKNDKKKINSSSNVYIRADKTRNVYEMSATTYNKLLTENVTKKYKHAQDDFITGINHELKEIADDLKITNRMDPIAETPAFISLKDHKPDVENHPKCRLINPAKSTFGKVSKVILDRIKSNIRELTRVNQWRNSAHTISWFESFQINIDKHSFLLTS